MELIDEKLMENEEKLKRLELQMTICEQKLVAIEGERRREMELVELYKIRLDELRGEN